MKKLALLFLVSLVFMTSAFSQERVTPALMWKLLPNEAIHSCVVSPDSKLVAAIGTSKIFLWKIATGESLEPRRIGSAAIATKIVFSPDSKKIASGGIDAVVHIWDVESGNKTQKLVGHRGAIPSLLFSEDDKALFTGS